MAARSKPGPWVTAYVDASLKRQRGAWSAWLRSHDGRHVFHGMCPRTVRTSTAAEFFAIYASVYRAVQVWPDLGGVLVKSDCTGALRWAQRDVDLPGKRRAVPRRIHRRLWQLVDAHRLEIEYQWVRGHRDPDASVSAYLNTQVDRSARQALRKLNAGRGGSR